MVATAAGTALVVGGLGVVGRALIEHLERRPGWGIVGLSRRRPDFATRARWIAADLLAPDALQPHREALAEVTHVFYAAYAPDPDLAAEAAANTGMLVRLIEAIEAASGHRLRHVQLMQGSKWYGNHLGPYRTPAREDDPRHGAPCFYYSQQDWLSARQRGKAWTWSALRPHGVLGLAVGSSMNQLTAVALYASLERARGARRLDFPGTAGAFGTVYQMTEAAWLARAMEWAATTPAAAGAAFNMTNGDLTRWCHLWPAVARFFAMEPGGAEPRALAATMAAEEPRWAGLVRRHALAPYSLAQLTNWSFADFVLGCGYDQISDMSRARNAGWCGTNPTEAMYVRLLAGLAERRIIPQP